MTLTDYTSFDEVRATLGVSQDELPDTVLGLPLYSDYLLGELEDVHASVPTKYSEVAEIDVEDRTAEEAKFYRTMRIFAAFAVAKQLTASLPLFSPKDISDGKATMSRYADSPYREVIKRVQAEYDRFRTRAVEAYAGLTLSSAAASTVRTFFSVASPDSDPVTGT